MPAPLIKRCVSCRERKPIADFPSNKDSSDGHGSYCRACKNGLAKERRQTNAVARFTHYIVTRLRATHEAKDVPTDVETNLEQYLGYGLWELKKQLREHVQATYQRTLVSCFRDGWHLDHKRPLSSFPPHKIGDDTFKACWGLSNLEMLPPEENLRKGSKFDDLDA